MYMELGLLGYSLLASGYGLLVSAYTVGTLDAPAAPKALNSLVEIEGWLHASISLGLLYQHRFFFFVLTLPVTLCRLAGVKLQFIGQLWLKVGYYCLLTCLFLYL